MIKCNLMKSAFFATAFASLSATADMIGTDDACKAAANWLAGNAIARATLEGAAVDAVSSRDSLYIVALKPSGYIVLSASDAVRPIIAFSSNSFVEPESGSPFYVLLESANAAAQEVESGEATIRHAKWTELIGSREGWPSAVKSLSVSLSDDTAVVVEPFLKTHWNQWQPYNDYNPVYSTSYQEVYRGRTPCGCVATAAAQALAYWKWPVRTGAANTYAHTFKPDSSTTTSLPIRFDGHVPLDWENLSTNYVYYGGPNTSDRYDLRGKIAESARYPIARLILFADNLAHMSFASGGSSANFGTVAGNASEWYETCTSWSISSDYDNAAAAILADLKNGMPVQVSIPGHAIVAHGWANDSNDAYIYVNYGWGGSNDGWMSLADEISSATTGFRPRKTVQLEPLPKISENSATIAWSLPECYDDAVEGFEITASAAGSEVDGWVEDFADEDGGVLFMTSGSAGTYLFADAVGLTSRSVLTYKLKSSYTLGSSFELQGRFDGGEWETLSKPTINAASSSSSWKNIRLFLGGRGGSTLELRAVVTRTGGSYYPQDYAGISIDDVSVADVIPISDPVTVVAGADSRSYTFTDLDAGSSYRFSVRPLFVDDDGAESDTVSTTIAGTARKALPGTEGSTMVTKTWSSSAEDEDWSINGTAKDDTSFYSSTAWSGGFSLNVNGEVTADTVLSFGWTVNQYYGSSSCCDIFTASFTDESGSSSVIWSVTNSTAQTARQSVALSLAAFAGEKGEIKVSYTHTGRAYTGTSSFACFYSPVVTAIAVPVLPEFAWEETTYTAHAAPEIVSVTGADVEVSEDFYRENALGTNVLYIQCSASTVSLSAYPSHLSMLPDEAVEVKSLGSGRFAIILDAAGVTDRSRMILTLAAANADGTLAYKDLSLRFSDEVSEEVWVDPEDPTYVTIIDDELDNVEIPISWLVENGLVDVGASVSDCAALVMEDADGDGLANWAEYVCGTDPNDAAKTLRATITLENGNPVVDYEPKNTIRDGYAAEIVGKISLGDTSWRVKTKEHHFFKVHLIKK